MNNKRTLNTAEGLGWASPFSHSASIAEYPFLYFLFITKKCNAHLHSEALDGFVRIQTPFYHEGLDVDTAAVYFTK